MWKRLELEWKILIITCVLFLAFALPAQRIFISRLRTTLEQSVDSRLESMLREQLTHAEGEQREAILASLERNRQWQALIPIMVREQRFAILASFLVLFCVLSVLALWTFRRLTQPLKDLAFAVRQIGKGKTARVTRRAGGALGRLEEAIIGLQEELGVLRERARVQGMETAWREIARIMAHEIKNPLTPIRLTLDRMEERAGSEETVDSTRIAAFVERINSQVDTLERLVSQFRSFSREPEVHPARVELADILNDIAGDMSPKVTTLIEGNAAIDTDRYLFNQVVLNIWKNALEAGADRIVARIHTTEATTDITVTDNGPGIDPKQLDRIWLPYVSLKKGGTGLGLAMVKRIVETLGGSVSVQSKTDGAGHGVTITLSFPQTRTGDDNGSKRDRDNTGS
jgi:signal transduction histidine kinase